MKKIKIIIVVLSLSVLGIFISTSGNTADKHTTGSDSTKVPNEFVAGMEKLPNHVRGVSR